MDYVYINDLSYVMLQKLTKEMLHLHSQKLLNYESRYCRIAKRGKIDII